MRSKDEEPYASVIIPTHDRHATLPLAVESVLRQSVDNIEVIIAGDGCTPSVREVAQGLAGQHRCVRFLDLPKAPFRGAANRDIAVRAALAPRIFYSDDDDLLLPHHVEVLGRELDDCEVIDTPAVSVLPEGRIEIGLHDSSNPLLKRMLLAELYKGVFDTHFAHRKRSYVDLRGTWIGATDHRVVLHMLKTFAAADVVWKTRHRVTALSFHGARRVAMDPSRRAAELRKWLRDIAAPGFEDAIRRSAGLGFHALRLAESLRKDGRTRSEVATLIEATVRAASGDGWTLEEWQAEALRAVVDLVFDRVPDEVAAARLLVDLCYPVLGPAYPADGTVSRFAKLFPLDKLMSALETAGDDPALILARFHIWRRLGQVDSGRRARLLDDFAQMPVDARPEFGISVASGLKAMGDLHGAWDWTSKLLDLVPESRHAVGFWKLRRSLAERLGFEPERMHADRQATRLAASMV